MAESCRLSVAAMCSMASVLVCAQAARADSPLFMPERAEQVNIVGACKPGAGYWFAGGGAVGDFNRNGLPDVFLFTGGLSPDRLYINLGDGTFEDRAADWGLTTQHAGMGASVADFNNNGYLDIYITSYADYDGNMYIGGRNKLYRNSGENSFTNVATQAGVALVHPIQCGVGSAWGDYNLNGHLDLYVTCWWPGGKTGALLKNNGDETFTDVTFAAGVFAPSMYGFQACFVDMDGNGWPDLLVAADYGTSRYYRNNGNTTFTNITTQSGTGIDEYGMGQTVADVNNSGLFDWYVTSIEYTQGPNPGNMLYINQGDHFFVEMSQSSGVKSGGYGWGAIGVDLDNDGWVELVEVNGALSPLWSNIPPKLYYNNRDGTFTDIAVASGMIHGDQGRGIARLDANRDGRQDILVMNYVHPWRFYRNETPNAGNWIGLHLDTSNNPLLAPDGYGAHVRVSAAGNSYLRYLHGDPSFNATSELNVHFGLGAAQIIDTIVITWPRGYVTTLHDVSVNQYLQITGPALADLTASGSVGVADLLVLLSRWGPAGAAHDKFADLDNDGKVDLSDLLILLDSWQ